MMGEVLVDVVARCWLMVFERWRVRVRGGHFLHRLGLEFPPGRGCHRKVYFLLLARSVPRTHLLLVSLQAVLE